MFDGEQGVTADRQRRWLSRALVAVGGTVAGVSAAWLFGSAQAVAVEKPSEDGTLRQVGALIRHVDDRSPGARTDGSEAHERYDDERAASPAEPGAARSGPVSTLSKALGTEACGRTTTVDPADRTVGSGAESRVSGPPTENDRIRNDPRRTDRARTDRARADRLQHDRARVSPTVSPGPDRARETVEESGPLRTVLDRDELRGTTEQLSDSVSDGLRTARREVDPLLHPVERVTGTLISGTTGEESLTGAVESGLGELHDSLRETVSGEQPGEFPDEPAGSTGIGAGTLPEDGVSAAHPGDTSDETGSNDSGASGSESDSREAAVLAAIDRDIAWPNHESHSERDGSSTESRGGKLPFPSGNCGCGTDTNTSGGGSHGGYGLGDSLPVSRSAVPSFGAITRANVYDPASPEGPQPGTTPD
ncbi:hypothetical protein SAMN04487820_11526 [Actinopolyspora mzabensis]|uniref:Uncharacterized protein n=1 Tax=Actinopolyspora mzabensis TaxID=995066 RepID=A0A1G9FGX3_ACTMZ|nr:hypothetical protein [Actinopolyspora mzabensis]SDK87638.1 hypothetical protein SAMN04487820_11526 [Actinopolyspora mzabensis]